VKLRRLHIDGYGCHRDREWAFSPTLNLILGPNEAGKTTLVSCLMGLLYPFNTPVPACELYAPWQDAPFSASLELETDDGEILSIHKVFDDGEVNIKNQEGEDVTAEYSGETDLGEALLKLTREEFLKTALIHHGEIVWTGGVDGRQQLAQRLGRMVDEQNGAGLSTAIKKLRQRLDLLENSLREVDTGLNRTKTDIASTSQQYNELLGLEHEEDRQQQELLGLDRSLVYIEYRELLDTEKELSTRIEEATAMTKEVKDAAAQLEKLGVTQAIDLTPFESQLEHNRAIREAYEKDYVARQDQFRLVITERIEKCEREISQQHRAFHELSEGELENLRTGVDRWLELSRKCEEIKKSLKEEEERLAGEGILQKELQDLNLRFTSNSESTREIESGDEKLRDMDGKLIQYQQELREHEGERNKSRGHNQGATVLGAAALVFALISFFIETPPALYIELGVLGAILLAYGLIRNHMAATKTKEPIARLEEIVSQLRRDREQAFRTLETIALEMGFANYKECRTTLEHLRRNQMRMGSLQQLQSNIEHVLEDQQRIGGELVGPAGKVNVSFAANLPDAGDIDKLSGMIRDYIDDRKELVGLQAEGTTRSDELASLKGKVEEMRNKEVRILADAGIEEEDPEQGGVRFKELLSCQNQVREIAQRREHAELVIEKLCRGKSIEKLRGDLDEIEKQLEERRKRWPELLELQPMPEGIDSETEQGRLRSRQVELSRETNRLSQKIKELRHSLPSLSALRERRAGLEDEIAEMHSTRDKLQLALEVLNQSLQNSHQRWSEELTNHLGQLVPAVTAGRYQSASVTPELAVNLVPAAGLPSLSPEQVETGLSTGALDQVYFCLRVAVAELISPTASLPLLLDDPFMSFDPERQAAALDWMRAVSAKRQVLLFSSSPNYEQLLAAPGGLPAAQVLQLNADA
jgi:DNA repair exonuclease SbcCD ATPase subunit